MTGEINNCTILTKKVSNKTFAVKNGISKFLMIKYREKINI